MPKRLRQVKSNSNCPFLSVENALEDFSAMSGRRSSAEQKTKCQKKHSKIQTSTSVRQVVKCLRKSPKEKILPKRKCQGKSPFQKQTSSELYRASSSRPKRLCRDKSNCNSRNIPADKSKSRKTNSSESIRVKSGTVHQKKKSVSCATKTKKKPALRQRKICKSNKKSSARSRKLIQVKSDVHVQKAPLDTLLLSPERLEKIKREANASQKAKTKRRLFSAKSEEKQLESSPNHVDHLPSSSYANPIQVPLPNFDQEYSLDSIIFKPQTLQESEDVLRRKDEEGHEDDIYEFKKFDRFKELLVDTSVSPVSSSMHTPELGIGMQLTPQLYEKLPRFVDCISPTDYALYRKVAEDCIYGRKESEGHVSDTESSAKCEKKKLEFNEVVEEAYKIQKSIEKLMKENDSDSDNSYFSILD